MRRLAGLCACAALILSAGSALALDIPLHTFRVGIVGGGTVNIVTEVSESDPDPVYPGFVGFGWLFGGRLSYDYRDIIGLSIEFLYSSDSASGSVEFDGDVGNDNKKEESDFTLSADAFHLPIYMRAQIPGGLVRPYLTIGVDLVLSRWAHDMKVEQQGDAPAYTPGCNPGVDCDPFPAEFYNVSRVDSQTFFLVGLGFDIEAGPFTIPIEFRGLFDFGQGDSINDRVTSTNGVEPYFYRNAWNYQVMMMVGVNYVIF